MTFPMKKLSIIAIFLASAAIVCEILTFDTHKESSEELYRKAFKSNYRIYSPTLPDTLAFAGERVPLETYYVYEGLDRELLVNTYWQSNMMLWLKRAGRYFPIIEPILKRNGVPDDFKYLCVIESGLMNVTSPAGAAGYWQFIPATAKRYGLEITTGIDMRRNLEASTEAACRFLNDLHRNLGSWTAAAAAYNCGEAGLSSRMRKQGVASYYDTYLNRETTRYLYRILAAKLIMQSPQDYGFCIRQCDLYPPLRYQTVQLSGQNVDLYRFAKSNGTTYKMLRELNPWFDSDVIPNKANKTYSVKIPVADGHKNAKLRQEANRPAEPLRRL